VPVTEAGSRTRRRNYRIADNFLAFWLSIVEPYRAEIERGLGPNILSPLMARLDHHMGPRYEEAFRAHLRRLATNGTLAPESVKLIPRGIEAELRDILSVSRAAAIIGPRQAGKSTLAKQLQAAGVVPNHFTLDDEGLRAAARADPDGFALSLPRPAVIDEIQRAPELVLAIKQILDRDQTPGQFLLTGSADLLTAGVIADALPGRVEYVNLWPLSAAEIAGRNTSVIDALLGGAPPRISGAPKGRAASAELVLAGGFPEARARAPRQRARYFRDTDKREVDLVIESPSGEIIGIEAKSAANANASDARGLHLLRDKLGPRFKTGIVIYQGKHTLPLGDRTWAVPISGLWADNPDHKLG
jgi:predicted AAA+ superfamily ATPase